MIVYDFKNKWYNYLLKKCNVLNMRTIYKTKSGNEIELSDIFVPQNIVQNAVYGIGRSILTEGDSSEGRNNRTIEDLLSSDKTNRHLIVGMLGTGKTSLLNYLVVQLTQYYLYGKTTKSLIVDKYKDKFVSYMSVKELVANSKEEIFCDFDINAWIVDNIKKTCNDQEKKEVENHFAEVSAKGILLFVDGLDEIGIEDRKTLLKLLNSFCKNQDNTVITTIRKEVLVEESWINEIAGYQQITLAEFSRDQIKNYIFQWKNKTDTEKKTTKNYVDKIVKDIYENPYLRELAANPLFLTLMMIISEEEGTFLKSRTKVYEAAVKLILGKWNEDSVPIRDSLQQIREALELAAYNGMNNLISQKKKTGDVSAFITDAFAKRFPDKNISDYIRIVSEKTGLIVQNADGVFSFALQSFMEYLAGCYISEKLDITEFIKQQRKNLIPWQEVVVFGVTKMGVEKPGMAMAVLYRFIKNDYQRGNEIEPELVFIAGIIAHELLCESDAKDAEEIQDFIRRVKTWLKNYICNKNIPYRQRYTIGNVLDRLGDDREGVGCISIDGEMYPDIRWIHIPAGKAKFGSLEGIINIPHEEETGEYLISKYPITNKQFSLFLNDGYKNKQYWTEEGWAWVNGKDQSYFAEKEKNRYTEERKKQYEMWLKNRGAGKRNAPFWWDDYPWNVSNRPVVGITWYEAVAYCKWMNVKCRKQLETALKGNKMVDVCVCLPTLEEWEKAARGPMCAIFPWGNNIDSKKIRGNFDIAEINETCAVGIFSEGKSKYGLYDVAGNVYEWITTGVLQTNDGKWVRQPEDLEARVERLCKGGSWNMEYERAKAAYDEWDYPLIFDQNTGFRPIVRLKSQK